MKKDIKQKKWKIILYKTKDGKCPVADFIKTLPIESKKKNTHRNRLFKRKRNRIT